MANKNHAGNTFYNHMKRMERTVERIDRKEKRGEYTYEDRKVQNAMTVTASGDRVWSF